MYSDNRNAYRQFFFTLWQKYQKKIPLETNETQLIEIILQHPEYHRFLDKQYENQEFTIEENPFFHMSLHLAIREQIATNRPVGITSIYQNLMMEYQNNLLVEHMMMERLAHFIYLGQKNGTMASDSEYLDALRTL